MENKYEKLVDILLDKIDKLETEILVKNYDIQSLNATIDKMNKKEVMKELNEKMKMGG